MSRTPGTNENIFIHDKREKTLPNCMPALKKRELIRATAIARAYGE
jgi:hypothetical protein